nr:carboxypeptidase-like regulatory domain-containing protein [Allomuricauda sp.]
MIKKAAFILVFAICATAHSQTRVEGFIFDKSSNKPLPYCTLVIFGSKTDHTITNEDGKFALDGNITTDSLEIRHIGFMPKKEALSYFNTESRLYLETDVSALDEIVLTAKEDKEYPYRLLSNAIEKYRKNDIETTSKAFFKLTSSARNIPIEQIEGFYSGKQSLSSGIMDLKVKSGRFGHNKKFAFYSLDNTKILSDFKLFGTSGQILPNYPGNMSYDAISRKYRVRIDECKNCSGQEVALAFFPKRPNGRLFYGKMIVDHSKLIVKKIELGIKDPSTEALASINEHTELTPKEILMTFAFDPLDHRKIQYINFDFQMEYKLDDFVELIDSRTFLYLYDYGATFQEPYFTKEIFFNNDYDKIVALQASKKFWETNYQVPKSRKDERTTEFMKKNGYLINYESNIRLEDLEFTKPSVLAWQKDNRFQWEHLVNNSDPKSDDPSFDRTKGKMDIGVGKGFDTPVAAHVQNTSKKKKKALNIFYMVDGFNDKSGQPNVTSSTLMDINSFHANNDGSKHKLAFLNMTFDIYEVFRQLAMSRITPNMTFNEVKAIFDEVHHGAGIEVKTMALETGKGTVHEAMVKWNDRIKARLGIDNLN